jgi:hypothetical protein
LAVGGSHEPGHLLDPDRIREDQSTIVSFDQAAILERFEKSYGVALAAPGQDRGDKQR